MPKGGKKKGDEGVRETLLPIESDGVPSNSLADSHRQAIETVGEEVQHVNVDVSAFVKKVNELNTRKVRILRAHRTCAPLYSQRSRTCNKSRQRILQLIRQAIRNLTLAIAATPRDSRMANRRTQAPD
jgi:hypothetical protein